MRPMPSKMMHRLIDEVQDCVRPYGYDGVWDWKYAPVTDGKVKLHVIVVSPGAAEVVGGAYDGRRFHDGIDVCLDALDSILEDSSLHLHFPGSRTRRRLGPRCLVLTGKYRSRNVQIQLLLDPRRDATPSAYYDAEKDTFSPIED